MTDEIRLLIEKDMPAQIGKTLRGMLEQAELDAETVKKQADQIEKLKRTIESDGKTIRAYHAFDERNEKLNERQFILDQKERQLEIDMLKYQLAAEKDKVKFSQELAMGLVRNIEYRESLYDNKIAPYTDQHGCQQYANTTVNAEKTKKAQ